MAMFNNWTWNITWQCSLDDNY